MVNKQRYFYYLSKYYPGSNVDYGILKKEFPPKKNWFRSKRVSLDLGFVSFENDYDYMEVFIRHRKPPKSKKNPETKLTELEKQCLPRNLGGNKIVARKRIFVEHALTNIPLK